MGLKRAGYVLVVAAVMGVAGCSGGSSDDAKGSSPSATGAPTTTAAPPTTPASVEPPPTTPVAEPTTTMPLLTVLLSAKWQDRLDASKTAGIAGCKDARSGTCITQMQSTLSLLGQILNDFSASTNAGKPYPTSVTEIQKMTAGVNSYTGAKCELPASSTADDATCARYAMTVVDTAPLAADMKADEAAR